MRYILSGLFYSTIFLVAGLVMLGACYVLAYITDKITLNKEEDN